MSLSDTLSRQRHDESNPHEIISFSLKHAKYIAN